MSFNIFVKKNPCGINWMWSNAYGSWNISIKSGNRVECSCCSYERRYNLEVAHELDQCSIIVKVIRRYWRNRSVYVSSILRFRVVCYILTISSMSADNNRLTKIRSLFNETIVKSIVVRSAIQSLFRTLFHQLILSKEERYIRDSISISYHI